MQHDLPMPQDAPDIPLAKAHSLSGRQILGTAQEALSVGAMRMSEPEASERFSVDLWTEIYAAPSPASRIKPPTSIHTLIDDCDFFGIDSLLVASI